MRIHWLAVSMLGAALAAGPLFGQLSQYNPPGGAGAAETLPEGDLRDVADAARWHLGPLGVDPKLELREIAYVDPGGDAAADWTASVGAGLRFFLPVGHNVLFTAHALPEYIWWHKNGQNSRWGGEAGLGVLARAGRLAVDVRARGSDIDAFLTPEVNQRAQVKSSELTGDIEFALLRRLALFTRGTIGKYSGSDLATGTTPELENLDRHEDWLDLGLRWRPTKVVKVGAGAGRSRAAFDDPARDRSNEGTSSFLDLDWNPGKLEAGGQIRHVTLDGLSGSELQHFSGNVGNARFGWKPRDSFSLSIYGSRDLTYSVLAGSPYFLDRRQGVELATRLGHRIGLSFFRETGEREFPSIGVDDVESVGATADLTIRKLAFHVYGRNTKTDGVHGRQTIREISFGVSLGKFRALWY